MFFLWVIIELYKSRATHMKKHWGKMRSFPNRKRLSYFISQEIPDLFSNLKCSNKQLYIWRWDIICICKISVQNDIIKDILKKKNDVHWMSEITIRKVIWCLHKRSIRHFSVAPYITICPSTEIYFGLYLRGAMSAVTGIYLFRLLLNIIFFAPRSFFTLTNSAYPDEMPHDGISPVCKCKKTCTEKYISQLKCSRIFL